MKLHLNLVLVAALSSAPGVVAQHDAFDPVAKTIDTTLDEIREHPEAYKGVAVRFPVQFCSIGQVSNPFFTRFVPSLYTNFYAWSTSQPIWRKSEYDNVCGTLFMSKSAEQLEELYKLRLYDRVMLVGVVRNTFQAKPWIEVMKFERLSEKVDAPTLAHLFRGETHMQRRQWSRAVSEMSLAAVGKVPENVLGSVHENLGICYLRMGEVETAVAHLGHAVSVQGDDVSPQLAKIWHEARSRPELQLDREVEAVEIEDHQRPMWEAFEEAIAAPAR